MNSTYKYYLSLITIFRDETCYLKEWIDFHLINGVDHFYLYNHMSVDNPEKVLKPYIDAGIVDLIYWDHDYLKDSRGGIEIDDAVYKFKNDTYWLAHINIDEFLYPVDSRKDLKNVLSEFEDYHSISVNWLCFGSNHKKKYENKPVIERFNRTPRLINKCNTQVKSIVNPRYVKSSGVHISILKDGGIYVDEMKNILVTPSSRKLPNYKVLIINHYWLKSKNEFLEKFNKKKNLRMRYQIKTGESEFQRFDKKSNKQIDNVVINRYLKKVKTFNLNNYLETKQQ